MTRPAAVPLAVSRIAKEHPLRIAVESAQSSLTYAQLDQRSTAWAQALRARGCGRETLIGVCTSRSPDLLVALLAILKCGAAYLPLDCTFPTERLARMIDDSGARLLIADPPEAERMRRRRDPSDAGDFCPHMFLSDLDRESPRSTAAPLDAPRDGDLAYVIYTSGSTGRPKGVEITHGGLSNFVASMVREPGIDRADRVLAHTTLAFDIAALELWAPLAAGATVLLVDQETARDSGALVREAASRRATIVQATPTMWSLMLEQETTAIPLPSPLKALVGGEPLSRALATALCRNATEVWNMYGPTETTVWSSLWRVHPGAPIRIGRPIDNTTMRVMDETGAVVPAGEVGELYIGGAGVARGYRGRPELTAERFVRDAFSTDSNAYAYRTGDLAREVDGAFECLGRIDQQLKIDGYRVEPGEIESVLLGHDGVRQALVHAFEDARGDRRLVAYLVAAEPYPPLKELRALTAAALPAYMTPSAYVFLDAIPRLPNGKLDRSALPPPVVARPRDLPYSAPRTPTERLLCDMWSDVLDLSPVGIHDDFFELGGRSRLAARLFARIATELGRPLPLATLFETPTVAALAARVDASAAVSAPGIIAINPVAGAEREIPPFFCMHPVGGHVLTYRPLAQALGRAIPFYGIQAAGLDSTTPPHRTVQAMADYAIGLMKTVQPHGPYVIGGASFGGLIAFEAARQLLRRGEHVRAVVLFDTEFPPAATHAWIRRCAKTEGFRSFLYPKTRAMASALKRLPASARARTHRDEADLVTSTINRVIEANYRAMAAYLPARYPGRVTYFRAADAHPSPDTRECWRAFAGELEVHSVPGNHYTMRREPHVHTLAAALRRILAAVPAHGHVAPPSAA